MKVIGVKKPIAFFFLYHMTVKDKIQATLTDVKKNFAAGVAIYQQLGKNPNLKDTFINAAKRATKEPRLILKLEYCLREILKTLSVGAEVNMTVEDLAPRIEITVQREQKTGGIPFDAPEPIRKLHNQYILLAREEIQLHGRLFPQIALSDANCYEICVQIMQIKQKQDEIWDDIRKWKSTGEVPVVTTSGFKEGFEAAKRLHTLRTRPARLQKQIEETINEAEKEKYKATLKAILEEIAYIEKHINT